MKKYKLIKTDLMLEGKLIPEDSEITLSDTDAETLSEYLVLINSVSEKDNKSQQENSNKKRSKK